MSYIEIENVTLNIPIFDINRSFRKSIMNYCVGGTIIQDSNKHKVSIRALDNISFKLKKGDRLGLIGHNGSGKTTLLRVLAGIYKPEIGKIRYKGRITAMLYSGTGMDLDDTGLENISTMGMYFGMSTKEISSKKQSIVESSGIGDFIHLPMRTYSSGMQMRLNFAIATALDPEILIMDEGIGTGDAKFSEDAKIRIEDFYSKLDILICASHSDELIRKLCNKAILMEHGKIKAAGEVESILELYHEEYSTQ